MLNPNPWIANALLLVLLSLPRLAPAVSDQERTARQADLDRACESARTEQLKPLREKLVEKCVADQQFDTREKCDSFYADYGERSGHRAAMFYDLPPCVEAFEYARSQRAGD